MLENILKQIKSLKEEKEKIKIKIRKLEETMEDAPSIIDLEGQLDLWTDDKLLKLYDIEDNLYDKIQKLYSLIYQNSYLDANMMGDAIAKLLTQFDQKEYIHMTPTCLNNKLRIVIPKENYSSNDITYIPEGTIVLDNNTSEGNLALNIYFITSYKHENINDESLDDLYLNLNVPIYGTFKDNYIDIPPISANHHQIIKSFIESIIEYQLQNNKETLSQNEVDKILKKQIETPKKLVLTKN